jgi:hypothetical protein
VTLYAQPRTTKATIEDESICTCIISALIEKTEQMSSTSLHRAVEYIYRSAAARYYCIYTHLQLCYNTREAIAIAVKI